MRTRPHAAAILILIASGVAPALAQSTEPADPAARGIDLLSRGDAAAAKPLLEQAARTDAKNARLQHALALATWHTNARQPARDKLDAAVRAAPTPTRAMTVNLAAMHLLTGSNARAVSVLRDYLSAKDRPLDEPAVDAYGLGLSRLASRAGQIPQWDAHQKLLADCIARIEAARPGQRRWGSAWITDAAYAEKQQTNAVINKTLADIERRRTAAAAIVDREKQNLQQAQSMREDASGRRARAIDVANRTIAVHEQALATLETERRTAAARLLTPQWDVAVRLVGLDDDTPPAIGATARPSTPEPPPPTDPTPAAPPSPDAATPPPPPPAAPTVPAAPPRPQAITVHLAAIPVAPDLLLAAWTGDANALRDLSAVTPDGERRKVAVLRSDATAGLILLRLEDVRLPYVDVDAAFVGGKAVAGAFPGQVMFNPAAEEIAAELPPPTAEWRAKLATVPAVAGAPLIAGGKLVGFVTAHEGDDPASLRAVTPATVAEFLGTDAPVAGRARGDLHSNLVFLTFTAPAK